MSEYSNRRGNSISRYRPTSLSRTKRSRRTYAVEALESRTLLTYTFTYTNMNLVSLTGDAAVDSIVIDNNGFGFLEYSINGAAFSADWDPGNAGTQLLLASPATTATINMSTGNGSSVQLGTPAQAASANQAKFNVNAAPGNTLDQLIIDDSTSPLGAGTYTYNGGIGVIQGPLTDINVQEGTNAFGGGVHFLTGPAANTFNVLSTYQFGGIPEPVSITGGAADDTVNVQTANAVGAQVTVDPAGGAGNIVNVGNAGLIVANGAVNVSDSTGSTALNLNAQANATATDVTLDRPTNVAGFPFAVSGLSTAPINYGAGVTALNVNGGPGAGGINYHINDTQATTTTTITGGINGDNFLLSNAGLSGGLDHLVGPVVVDGGGGANTATLNDSSANFNDSYTVTPTTVDRLVFGGLTYSNLSVLSLFAENTLGTNGNNTIQINGTADGVVTNVNGQGGNDIINVNSTGINAAVNVTTGTDGSTVNVVTDSEPVNVSLNGLDTVNIGSQGGPGDIGGIQGPISIVNTPSFYTLNVHDENGASRTWTLDNNDGLNEASIRATGTVLSSPPATPFVSYRPGDLTALHVHGGPNGNTFDVNETTSFAPTTLDTGLGGDTVHVFASGNNTLDIHGQSGQDTVRLGGSIIPAFGMQGLNGTINVDNVNSFTDLILDDSQDAAGQVAFLDDDGTNGTVTGLAPATIHYIDLDTSSLAVHGGSGGNTFVVDGTLSNIFFNPTVTTLNTGTGDDTVHVHRTNAGSRLDIHGEDGQDTVDITDLGSTANILGAITVDNVFGFTDLTVDASQDAVDHDVTLTGETPATLTAMSPAPITYVTGDLSSLTLDTGPFGHQLLTVNFDTGNPIPAVTFPGLTWNAGADASSLPDSHRLVLRGTLPSGAFASETHNAEGDFGPEHQGDIVLVDATSTTSSLLYTGLQPIDDTAAAVNYTFNDFAIPDGSFNAINGPTVLGFDTIQFNSASTPPGAFETTNVANKTNIVFNANNPGLGVNGNVNITTPSTGLATLQFNTNNGADNFVTFVNVPPGVATSYNGSVEEDTTNVDGVGVPAGVTLTLNGGANFNTLNYNAGGLLPTVTPGPNPGEVIITLPGFGTVDATNYQQINITNVGPLVITPGPAVDINSVEGFQLVDQHVGTFSLTIPPIIPTPPGPPASAFTASIDWGDPSPDNAAGTITQDASNPSLYYITGTHTFAEQGSFTVNSTIAFNGGPITATVNGVQVSVLFDPVPPVAGTPDTATVTQGVLAVTAFPVVGTEGITIPGGPIGSFIDAGGADPESDYSATVFVTDAQNNVVAILPGTVLQQGTSAQYLVIAPAFTLPEEGTYRIQLVVADNDLPGPLNISSGFSTAIIADAPLTAVASPDLAGTEGTALTGVQVGSFTDANPTAPVSDFDAVIYWGDGGASGGAITQPGGVGTPFIVSGTHNYHDEGTYHATVVVYDEGGQVISTQDVQTTVVIADAALTAAPGLTVSVVEGHPLPPVPVGIFTDANPFGETGDFTATIDWGDGSPTTLGAVVKIGGDANGAIFQVVGNHTYSDVGTFPITITVNDIGGESTVINSSAVVSQAPILLTALPIVGIEGAALTPTPVGSNPGGLVLVASFTDFDGGDPIGDYSATVHWGDGGTNAGTIVALGAGQFDIFAPAHIYAEEGAHSVTVELTDADPITVSAVSVAVIGDAALTSGPAVLLTPNTGVLLNNAVVGTFTDANTAAPASDFTAVIDWGDGSPTSLGTIVATGGGAFEVHGTHRYAKPGVYVTKANVTDEGGSKVTLTGSATVTDLAVTGSVRNFGAQEGRDTGTIVLATFTDPNPLATVADVTAALPAGGWGDGTPGGPVTLAVQQIGGGPGGAIFQVLGSHTYAEEGSFTVNINVTTSGGVTTALTAGTATVADAPLASSGATITGIEGNVTTPQVIATFSDADPAGVPSDYTVTVNWGDGTPVQTLPASAITQSGSVNGVQFTITATHTYAEEGAYGTTITITDAGGATTTAHGTAIIADAALTPSGTQPNVSTVEGQLFSGPVAAFVDGNPTATIDDFTYVMIHWGDGSPDTAGTISQPGGVGTAFVVSGTHRYLTTGGIGTGQFPITVNVHDVGGATVTINNTANVAPATVTLTGQINPASVSGLANGVPNVTNVVTPNFFGTVSPTIPNEHVTLTATDVANGSTIVMGTAITNAVGAWNLTSVVLPQGTYNVTAVATDAAGNITSGPTPVTIISNLVIDTTGPKVQDVVFNRGTGTIVVTYSDPMLPDGTFGSGVALASVTDAANYLFTRPHARPNAFLITSITELPTGVPGLTSVQLTINNGHVIKGGFNFNFTIFAASTLRHSGVQDNATNAMDGEFYGTFPSGNGVNGGNFNARLVAFHNQVLPPITNVGSARPVRMGAVANHHDIALSHVKVKRLPRHK